MSITGQQISADVTPGGVDHSALASLNSTNYTHLTAANHTDLTDGGTTTLHAHTKIVASDGSPDPALSADATGNITAVADLKSASARFGDSTNYTDFNTTGHQTMVLNGRPWRDELADALTLNVTGPGVSANLTEGVVEFTHQSNLSDYALANMQLNHDKDLSASIYPHIHWFQAKNYSPNFLLQYRWQINGGAKATSWTNLACNTLAHTYSSGTIHQISYSAAISVPVGTTLSDIVQFRILRDNANTSGAFAGSDPYNTGGNATTGILYFDVHFQLNSLGSTGEYTK
jgi:hypothetical protein